MWDDFNTAVQAIDVAALDRAGLGDLAGEIGRTRAVLDGLEARITVGLRRLGASEASAAETLRRRTGCSTREAKHRTRRAEALRRMPNVADALSSGRLTGEHASALARAAAETSPEAVDRDAGLLVEASSMPADAASSKARDWVRHRQTNDDLERLHQWQRRNRSLLFTAGEGGMIAGIAKFDRVSGAQFQNLVEALADRLYRADGGRDNPQARTRAQCRHDALLMLVGVEPATPPPATPTTAPSFRFGRLHRPRSAPTPPPAPPHSDSADSTAGSAPRSGDSTAGSAPSSDSADSTAGSAPSSDSADSTAGSDSPPAPVRFGRLHRRLRPKFRFGRLHRRLRPKFRFGRLHRRFSRPRRLPRVPIRPTPPPAPPQVPIRPTPPPALPRVPIRPTPPAPALATPPPAPPQVPIRPTPPPAPPRAQHWVTSARALAAPPPVPPRAQHWVTPAPVPPPAPPRAATVRSLTLPVTPGRVRGSPLPARSSCPTLPAALSPAPPPTRIAARSPTPAPVPALAVPPVPARAPIRATPAPVPALAVPPVPACAPIRATPAPVPALAVPPVPACAPIRATPELATPVARLRSLIRGTPASATPVAPPGALIRGTPAPLTPSRVAFAQSLRLPVTVGRVRGSLPPTRSSCPTLPAALSPAPPPTRIAARSPTPAPVPALAVPPVPACAPIRATPAPAQARVATARSLRLQVTAGRVRGSPPHARSSCPTLPAARSLTPAPVWVAVRSPVPALVLVWVAVRSPVPAPVSAWDAPVDGGSAPRPNCAS